MHDHDNAENEHQREAAGVTTQMRQATGTFRARSAPISLGAPHAPSTGELKGAAISGARSYALSRVAIEGANLASVLVLARVIGPAGTGRAAVALVFPMLSVILTFEGLGSALVQGKEVTTRQLQTSMSLSLLSGAFLSLIVAALSIFVAPSVFGGPTAHLILLASPAFLIASVGGVSRALLMRDLRFKLMSRRDSTVLVLQSGVTVVLALLKFGASAYIWGADFALALDALIMLISAPPRGVGWNRAAARKITSFGLPAAGSGLVSALRQNIDFLILGVVFPARVTGTYYRAFQLGGVYQNKVSSVFAMMLFPLFSRAGSEDDLRLVRQRTTAVNAAVTLPLLGILIALAPQIVPLLYGPRWHAAILPTQILAGVGIASALATATSVVPMALGRSTLLFRFEFGFLLFYAAMIAVASQFGLTIVCLAALATYVVMLLISQRFLIDNLLGLPVAQLFIDVGPATASAAISTGVAAGMALVLGSAPAVIVVCLASAAALIAYLLTLRIAFPNTWVSLRGLTRSFVRAA